MFDVVEVIERDFLAFGVIDHYEEFLQLVSILRPAFFPSLAFRYICIYTTYIPHMQHGCC